MNRARSEEETVRVLRETLAGRAGVVTHPAEVPEVVDIRPARRHAPRWVPPLLAAAAAAAVAGTVVAIQHSTGHPTPPANSSNVTHPAPTHAPSPTPNGSRFCTTKLPPAWLSTPLGFGSSNHINGAGALADGPLIVSLGQDHTTELLRVTPNEGQPIDLLSVPAQSGAAVTSEIDGDQAVLMVRRYQAVSRLYVYDDRTVHKTPLSFSGTVDDATLMDGTVYWDERASTATDTGRVIAYDIATGSRRIVWHGTFPRQNYPVVQKTAGGVYLGAVGKPTTVPIAPRNLPPVVAAHMTPQIREFLLVSDGSSYAWLTSPAARVLYLWSPGMSAPQRFNLGEGDPKLVGNGFANFSIDGRWLYAPRGNLLIDLDTSAMARLPGNITAYLIGGGYLNRMDRSHITRLPLTDMPDLHC